MHEQCIVQSNIIVLVAQCGTFYSHMRWVLWTSSLFRDILLFRLLFVGFVSYVLRLHHQCPCYGLWAFWVRVWGYGDYCSPDLYLHFPDYSIWDFKNVNLNLELDLVALSLPICWCITDMWGKFDNLVIEVKIFFDVIIITVSIAFSAAKSSDLSWFLSLLASSLYCWVGFGTCFLFGGTTSTPSTSATPIFLLKPSMSHSPTTSPSFAQSTTSTPFATPSVSHNLIWLCWRQTCRSSSGLLKIWQRQGRLLKTTTSKSRRNANGTVKMFKWKIL